MAKTRRKTVKTPVKSRKSNTMNMKKSPVISHKRNKTQTQKKLNKNIKTMLYESPLKHLRHNGEPSSTASKVEDTTLEKLENSTEQGENKIELDPNTEKEYKSIVHNNEERIASCSKSATKTKREENISTFEETVPKKKRKLNKSPLSRLKESEQSAAPKILNTIDESIICVDDLELDAANDYTPKLQPQEVNSVDIVVLDDTLPQPSLESLHLPISVDTSLAENMMNSIIVLDDEPQTLTNEPLTRPGEDCEVVWASGPTIPTTLSSSRQNKKFDILKCDKILLDTGGEPSNLRYLKNDGNKKLAKKSPRVAKIGGKNLSNKKVADITRGISRANISTKVAPKAAKLPVKKKNKGELIFGAQQSSQSSDQKKRDTKRSKKGALREIVIDGCNVAMAYTNNKVFSEKGIKMLIDYFSKKGHTVKVFVPQHKRSRNHLLLEKWYEQGIVVFTPSRKLGNKYITSYDDRYIIEYATACNGVVVSQDQFRDLYAEKSEYRETIENRLLIPTFVGDYVMFPEDPLGRNGPSLAEFLKH